MSPDEGAGKFHYDATLGYLWNVMAIEGGLGTERLEEIKCQFRKGKKEDSG